MLEGALVMATLPAHDLGRARDWYAGKLGLEPVDVIEGGHGLVYEVGGTRFLVFLSGGAPSGSHTQLSFTVSDARAAARWLEERGVVFEQYEDLDQEDGLAVVGSVRSGWFQDSEGNLIGLVQNL